MRMPWKKRNYQNAKPQKLIGFAFYQRGLNRYTLACRGSCTTLVGKALLKKLIILRVLETYGESDKNTFRVPRHYSVKARRASKIKGVRGKSRD